MNSFRIVPLVVAGLICTAVRCGAQPIIASSHSIESMAMNCDALVIGTVVAYGDDKTVDEFGTRPVTIAVAETLKGAHRRRLQVRLGYPQRLLDALITNTHRLMVARSRRATRSELIDLAAEDLAVLTADLTVLRQSDEVISAAREAIRRAPGVVEIHTFDISVPRDVVAGTKWAEYHGILLSVPVDERLEQRAHASVTSDDYARRREAAEALRYFKSDGNVARVGPLLDDPGWSYLRHPAENRGIEVRHFGVRKAAYETFQYWGIPAKKPAFRETVENLDVVRFVSLDAKEATAATIKDLKRFSNLDRLNIYGGVLTEAEFDSIESLTTLKTLELRNVKFDRAQIDGLKKKRPDLKISR